MYNVKQKMGNMYQVVKDYFVRLGAAAVITFAPNIAIAKNPEAPPVKKEGIEYVLNDLSRNVGEFVDGLGTISKKAENCPPLDYYIAKGDPKGILEYTLLLPVSCAHDILRTIGDIVVKAPEEAMKRAKAEKEENYRTNPKQNTGLAALAEDTGRYVNRNVEVLIEGTANNLGDAAKYAIKNPFDAAAKTGLLILVGRWISDAAHRTEHHHRVTVQGEELPPKPPFPNPNP